MSRRKGRYPPDVEAKARALLAAGDYDRTREAEDETSRLVEEARRSVGAKATLPLCVSAECVPHPWSRPRWDSKRGRTFTSASAEKAGRELAALLRGSTPAEPYSGALSLALVFGMPIPKKRAAWQREGARHVYRPDVDNLSKLVMDVLSRLKWWGDDAQVSTVTASKVYSERPGVHLRLARDP